MSGDDGGPADGQYAGYGVVRSRNGYAAGEEKRPYRYRIAEYIREQSGRDADSGRKPDGNGDADSGRNPDGSCRANA